MTRWLIFFVLFPGAFGLTHAESDGNLHDYRGTLNGTTIIGLALLHGPDRELHGSYFYKRYLKDIPLKGKYIADRDIELREYDDSGSIRATFHLRFAETDPAFRDQHLKEEVLVGTWNSGSKTYPVHLSLADEIFVDEESRRYESMGVTHKSEFEKEAEKFYFAVLQGDKRAALQQVQYPLLVFLSKKKLVVHSSSELLHNWNKIFTPEYVACLARGIPHNMFVNYRGAMIGNGEIWFDEKGHVVTLNPCLFHGREF
jgi:hypothetical protein